MERLAAKPTAGVPQACRGWGETMGAYRFFDNDEVEWGAILEPHWRQTEQRMAAQSVVLCLQDTTELDFNGRQAMGLGPLSYEAQRGMYLHPTYAVTPECYVACNLRRSRVCLSRVRRERFPELLRQHRETLQA
ncbi:hypothetical protein BGV48_18475 [Burkholderia ubonensis]|nr:hypothetical protein BGV48_18475 [Burkholderia ubonensis]